MGFYYRFIARPAKCRFIPNREIRQINQDEICPLSLARFTSRPGTKAAGFTRRYLCATLTIAFSSNSYAVLPQSGQVVSGAGSIAQTANSMTVQQNTQNLSINWQSFGVGAGQSLQFKQPSPSSIALNRVLGQDPSMIFGRLSANGQIFIVNPNGVLFGVDSQVNVGALVASSNTLSEADFQAKRYRFFNDGKVNAVINRGNLHAADGGYIALLAPEVRNEGIISARLGTVLLGAANQTNLVLQNGSLVGYNIDKGALNALADNKLLIRADGGQVILSAKAADLLARAVVNNDGVIEARSLQNHAGVIRLLGDAQVGQVRLTGKLDASAGSGSGSNGGYVETSAAHVTASAAALVTTASPMARDGNWVITQSNDVSISDKGENISGTMLAKSLHVSNVTVRTLSSPIDTGNAGQNGNAGDILLNSNVAWAGTNQLSLIAYRDININAVLANSSGGNLLLRANDSANASGNVLFGAAGKVNVSGGGRTDIYYNPLSYAAPVNFLPHIDGPYTAWMLVNNVSRLQDMSKNLSGDYALGKDIDASVTSRWNGGAGFMPIGNSNNAFHGQFDGENHIIYSLYINRPASFGVGLFGAAYGKISNLGLVYGNISGQRDVGGLVGTAGQGIKLNHVFYTGTVKGSEDNVGALAGYLSEGNISDSWSRSTVTGNSNVGGLAGALRLGGGIDNSFAIGTVTGSSLVGGMVGSIQSTFIRNSSSKANVTGDAKVGGLVGSIGFAEVSDSSATGIVKGSGNNIGGLFGELMYARVSNAYATGSVTGSSMVGGLGGSSDQGNISNAYSTSAVKGDSYTGGLVGSNNGALTQVFHVGVVSGKSQTGGLVGGNFNAGTITNAYSKGLVTGLDAMTGGLVGRNMGGALSDVYSSADVKGNQVAGGLVGYVDWGNIRNAYSSGAVSGSNNVGGLVGIGADGVVDITNAHSTSRVSGTGFSIGGLVGQYTYGTISNAYATGAVTGGSVVGGLVGDNHQGNVNKSYSSGTVIGRSSDSIAGGLIGQNAGTIEDTYSKANVIGKNGAAGGLVGRNSGSIKSSYSNGKVTAGANVGGLVGLNDGGNIRFSYWDTNKSNQMHSDGGTGLSSAQMKQQASYAGFDFIHTWSIDEGHSTPLLK